MFYIDIQFPIPIIPQKGFQFIISHIQVFRSWLLYPRPGPPDKPTWLSLKGPESSTYESF